MNACSNCLVVVLAENKIKKGAIMERTFSEALKNRRTYYSITDQSPIPDQEIECIINLAVRHVPSAFNSQSTRVVLLLGKSHKKLWNIVRDALRKIVPGRW